ncbi:hypothetical protein [Pseudomonas sp. GXZC]|uniref:hypothetical protein n=1 Tax=Pseudomonas sp. GXZC TaxID=3003351 RepID=UPI0022AABDB0|nr:hypothetical protein [Pseudomonas sp. GXZC]WAT32229.1 hypothetical protein OZ428_33675 [Pseudomonas sp. GXZC]
MRSPNPNAGPQASKWLDQLPHDFLSHRGTWRQAFERLIELEPVSHLPDQDEKGFWKHELNAFDVAYRELDVCVDEVETDEVWGDRLPHDFLSHRETWRQGFERLIELEPESHRPDEDQRGFWQHELDAFDLAYRELDEILTKRSVVARYEVRHGQTNVLSTHKTLSEAMRSYAQCFALRDSNRLFAVGTLGAHELCLIDVGHAWQGSGNQLIYNVPELQAFEHALYLEGLNATKHPITLRSDEVLKPGVLDTTEMAAIKAIEQNPALVGIPTPDESAPEIETAVLHVSPW